jgi:hypothetical protein
LRSTAKCVAKVVLPTPPFSPPTSKIMIASVSG